jgi:transposase
VNQNPLKMKITESSEALLELLSQQTHRWNHLKVETLYLLKSGVATTFQQVATLLELHQETPKIWFQKYEKGGLKALLAKPHIPLSIVPDWAAERLLEELQKAAFLPTAGITQAWLRTLGLKVSNDTASLLISTLKPHLQVMSPQTKAQGTGYPLPEAILLASDVYQPYEQWKQQHQIASDAEALSQIIGEYFECNQANAIGAPDALQEPAVTALSSVDAARQQDVPALLHQDGLAQRLAVNSSLLSRNRSKPTFARWSQQHDPDGISWQWLPTLRKYRALT